MIHLIANSQTPVFFEQLSHNAIQVMHTNLPKNTLLPWLSQAQNAINLCILLLNFFAFFICWYWSHRYQKANSIPRLNQQLRELWIKCFTEHKIDALLAVHTLRNSIMVSTVLSSSTILFILALFSLLGHVPELFNILNNLPFNTSNQAWLEFKVLCLIVWQIVVFFCFMTSIRYYRHSSFMVSIPFSQMNYQTQLLTVYIERAANYYSIGQKLMLFSIPLCAWLLGNTVFILTTLLTIAMIYVSDKFE